MNDFTVHLRAVEVLRREARLRGFFGDPTDPPPSLGTLGGELAAIEFQLDIENQCRGIDPEELRQWCRATVMGLCWGDGDAAEPHVTTPPHGDARDVHPAILWANRQAPSRRRKKRGRRP